MCFALCAQLRGKHQRRVEEKVLVVFAVFSGVELQTDADEVFGGGNTREEFISQLDISNSSCGADVDADLTIYMQDPRKTIFCFFFFCIHH